MFEPDSPLLDSRAAHQIVDTTPLLKAVERVEFLDKGYSHDRKYVLWESGSPTYLLRLSDVKLKERRRTEFDLIAQHRRRGSLCPESLVFGTTDDGKACYSVMSYIPGESAEEALPRLPERLQFEVGLAAGRELRKLHELRHPDEDFDWAAHRKAKYARYLKQARELGLDFQGRQVVEAFIEANERLLDTAPVRFQHDDCHPANLIVQDGELAGVVDFNRCDWGDPIENFYKVPWPRRPPQPSFRKRTGHRLLLG